MIAATTEHMKPTTIRFPALLLEKLGEASALRRVSRAAFIRSTLEIAVTHWSTHEKFEILNDLMRAE